MRLVPRSDLATCGILEIYRKGVLHLASWHAAVNSALRNRSGPRDAVHRPMYEPAREDTILTHSDGAANHKTPLEARRCGALAGRARVPGDKSISHRALILGALTVGETRITGLLEGDDVVNTAKAMRALGAVVERTGVGAWRVNGVGVGGFSGPDKPLDFGNSGTGCRLVMGAVGGCPIVATFDGDASLRKRPMRRVLDPLERMGARTMAESAGGRLPLTLRGATDPIPIVYEPPVASAQLKSAVLLAGLAAPGE